MRPAFIAAVVLAFAIHLAPRSKPQEHPAEKAQTAADKHPSAVTAVPPHAPNNQQGRPQSDEHAAKNQSPHWYESPEWVLVFVGIVTAIVIGWQACESRRSTEASRRSVELQKKAMEQWVETVDWRIDYTYTKDGTEVLPIQFKIRNPTKFKVILHETVLWINRKRLCSIIFRGQLLPPGSFAIGDIEYPLSSGQVGSFRKANLQFEIGGVIRFVDTFGVAQKQRFGYRCFCRSPDKSAFEPVPFSLEWVEENKEERKET